MEKNLINKLDVFLVSLVYIAVVSAGATTDPSDAGAVRVLYSSLKSPGQLTMWNAYGGDPCDESWKGITCAGSRITEIRISGMGLTGSLGYTLTNLLSLKTLDVSNNNLAGDISYQLPYNVEELNLANNQFTGGIPYSISNLTSLVKLNLAHNQLQGYVIDIFKGLSSLSTLDLSFNQFSGGLPQSFSSLSKMNSMYLQNNMLSGPIDVLADLPLKNLNVENNQFTGWIPDSLRNGVNLRSGGNMWSSGPAPPPPPPGLHYPNSNPSSGQNSGSSSESSKKSKSSGGVIAGVIVALFVVGGAIAFFIVRRRSKRSSSDVEKIDVRPIPPLSTNDPPEFKSFQPPITVAPKIIDTPAPIILKPPPSDRHRSFDEEDFSGKPVAPKKSVKVPANVEVYSIADLQMATNSFSFDHVIGEGLFGRVYRATIDGVVIAVRKLDYNALPRESSDEFLEMVSKLSELHHSNLSEMVGYCSEHGQHLLAYEFHKHGSLHDFLHIPDEQSKSLIWNTRVRIALGIARALEYLHEMCDPPIIHKNTNSENILLDSELNAHLSDCIASFLPSADQMLSEEAGSGYTAPEVTMAGQYTQKSDVYSFGVVMLELLTGRQPHDSARPRAEQSLVRWATPQLHDIDALSKMVDPSLKGLYPVKALSRFADVIALCVQPEPEFRPPMSEVVESLMRLMQRSNMSRRTVGVEAGLPPREENGEYYDFVM